MREFKDWKEFITRVLINSGQFEKPVIEFKGEVEIETYKLTDKNSLTEIRVGYFLQENKLIYLHIFNPTVPGYNKYVEDEYFIIMILTIKIVMETQLWILINRM
ncbi:hypothetical protein BST91_05660 [Nonlabens tegetincola]|uniref:hypothetical protein n=1 Tax=Nonlabens tegetincola TaxID=323273 RepID=UPI000A204357|nr:hypothetical protein [Nonlabens tegetincola]ARN71171.1 hypothetical protein BST91_05660 [Nonlabens tegetincola]